MEKLPPRCSRAAAEPSDRRRLLLLLLLLSRGQRLACFCNYRPHLLVRAETGMQNQIQGLRKPTLIDQPTINQPHLLFPASAHLLQQLW